MKIGILTLKLGDNYGGILQNYALQLFLKEMGKDPFTFLIEKKLSWRVKLSSYLYRCFRVYILRDKIPLRVWRKKDEDEIICQNMYRFISQNITMTEEIRFADLYLYSKKNRCCYSWK